MDSHLIVFRVNKLVNTIFLLFCYCCCRQHSIINKHRQISMSHLLVKYQIIIIVVITRITVSVSIVVFLTRVRDRRTVVLQRQKKQKTNNKQINNNKQNKQTNKKQTNKHQFSAVAQ